MTLDEYNCQKMKDLQNKKLTLKEKDSIEKSGSELIPQYWWGDIENPQIVILGKNPRLKIDGDKNDLEDNKKMKDKLENNMKFSDREDEIINLIYKNYVEKIYFQKWWQDALNDLVSSDSEEPMKGIAIYNLFGYYSGESSNITMNDLKESHIYCINEIKTRIRKQIVNSKAIFLLWKSSWVLWKKILGNDVFVGKTIYLVNEYNSSNNILSKAVPLSDREMDYITSDFSEIIKDVFKNR